MPPVYYYSSECRTLDPRWCVVIKQPISVQNVRQPHPFSISDFLRSKSITQQKNAKKIEISLWQVQNSQKFKKKNGYSEMYTAIQSDSQSKLYSTAHKTLWNTLGQLRGGTAHIPVKTWLNESTKHVYIHTTQVCIHVQCSTHLRQRLLQPEWTFGFTRQLRVYSATSLLTTWEER